ISSIRSSISDLYLFCSSTPLVVYRDSGTRYSSGSRVTSRMAASVGPVDSCSCSGVLLHELRNTMQRQTINRGSCIFINEYLQKSDMIYNHMILPGNVKNYGV